MFNMLLVPLFGGLIPFSSLSAVFSDKLATIKALLRKLQCVICAEVTLTFIQ